MKYHPLPCRCPISTTYDAAVVATSAPVALDDLSRTPNNLISPLIERSSAISQTMVCEPVHVFRLVRKFFKHVRAPSQSQPDFLCLREYAIARRLLLALIRTPIAVAAREQAANIVHLVTRRPVPPCQMGCLAHTNHGPNRHGVQAKAMRAPHRSNPRHKNGFCISISPNDAVSVSEGSCCECVGARRARRCPS